MVCFSSYMEALFWMLTPCVVLNGSAWSMIPSPRPLTSTLLWFRPQKTRKKWLWEENRSSSPSRFQRRPLLKLAMALLNVFTAPTLGIGAKTALSGKPDSPQLMKPLIFGVKPQKGYTVSQLCGQGTLGVLQAQPSKSHFLSDMFELIMTEV